MHDTALKPLDAALILLLAAGVAAGVTAVKPLIGLQVALGLMILFIAFISTRGALFLLITAMLLSPEIGVGFVQGRGVGGRAITLRLDDILLIVIGFSWFAKTVIYRELPLLRWTPVNRPILYYMCACVLATLIGVLAARVQPLTGMFFVLKYFEYFFIYFMVINNVRTREQMSHLLIALLATCCLISLYAIAQMPSGERATAPFEGETGEPNTLGGYLVFIMAIVSGLLLHLRAFSVRVGLTALMVCIAVALAATLSRSSYLAAAALFASIAVTQWRRPTVLATVLVIALLIPLVAPGGAKDRVMETFTGRRYGGEIQIAGITVDSSTTERIRSWERILEGWAQQPIVGYGITGYAWADAQYVKILGETGLVGLTAFVFLMARLWHGAWRAYRSEQDPLCRGLAHGFLLGVVAMLVHAIGTNTFIIVRIMEPFWLCAGLVMVLSTLEGKEPASEAARP